MIIFSLSLSLSLFQHKIRIELSSEGEPSGTLIEATLSRNVYPAGSTVPCPVAAIVIDAAMLGGVDVQNESYLTRIALASVFARRENLGLIRIHTRSLVRLPLT